jgi:hypothetical protein
MSRHGFIMFHRTGLGADTDPDNEHDIAVDVDRIVCVRMGPQGAIITLCTGEHIEVSEYYPDVLDRLESVVSSESRRPRRPH